MVILLISAAWLLLMSLIVGLCHSARMGEAQRRQDQLADAAGDSVVVLASRGTTAAVRPGARAPANVMAQAGGAAG